MKTSAVLDWPFSPSPITLAGAARAAMRVSSCALRSNPPCLRQTGCIPKPVDPLITYPGRAGRCGVMRSPGSTKNTRISWRVKSQEGQVEASRMVFKTSKTKTFIQGVLSQVPNGLTYAAAVGLVGITGLLGYVVGSKSEANMRTAYQALGTVVGVGCAAKVVGSMKESRDSGAAIDLYNLLVAKNDPSSLQKDDVAVIQQQYGIDIPNKLSSELKTIYDEFLTSMIPQGVELSGDEPEKVRRFKYALGITDEDAAAVHMDVGRRLRRVAVESEGKNAGTDARKKSEFLLPLKRVFGVTEAQIMVARRDNAKGIFGAKIEELGGVIQSDRTFLQKLREFQNGVMLKDEVAAQAIKDANLHRVESALYRALENIRDRSRDKEDGIPLTEIQGILQFNQEMEALSLEKENDLLPPGLGRVTIHGGAFEKDVSSADRRDLFRTFLEERMALDGQITAALEKDLDDLTIVLALGTKEAESIREESASKMYRRLLRDEVQSGRLDAAESKAAILQKLCDQVRFQPELAALMHKSIYKQKVDGILDAEKRITDERNEELVRLRKLMCIPEKDVEDVMLETVGGLFKTAINDALGAGVDSFCEQDKKNVRQAMEELRVDQKMAKTVLDQSARQAFLKYISQSRLKPNKLAAAKELKSMVMFSNSVVAPLLEEIKGNEEAEKAAAQAEFEEILAEAKRKAAEEAIAEGEDPSAIAAEQDDVKIISDDEDVSAPAEETPAESEGMPSSLKKSKEGAEGFKEISNERKVKELSQKEINLADDLETNDCIDIYRNYLIYCMSGDVMAMPMGGTVVLERDVNEFGRLSQLGDILGLSPMSIMKVHTDMAEDAYRNQVKAILAGGTITKEKTDALTDVREKLGLTKEQGEKIVKGVQNEALAQSMQSAKAMGDLDLQKILDMKDSGVEIDSFTSVQFRKSLFQKEAVKAMSDGKGNFDEEYMMNQLPEDLLIDKDQARKIVEEAATAKAKLLTVQAMSDLRMRNFDNAIEDVNNLLVCTKIVGSDSAPKWDRKEEIMDLYSVYYWKVKEEQKVSGVQGLFGISDSDAETLKQTVDSGGLKWAQEVQQEDEIFF